MFVSSIRDSLMAGLIAPSQLWRHSRQTVRRFRVRTCALVTLLSFVLGTVGVPLGYAHGGGGCCSGKSGGRSSGCPCCKAGRPCHCGCSCSSKGTAVVSKLPPCCAKRQQAAAKQAGCCNAVAQKSADPRLPSLGCHCGKGPVPSVMMVTHPRWIPVGVSVDTPQEGAFFVPARSPHAPHVGSRPTIPPPRSLPC